MPYYREYFANAGRSSKQTTSGVVQNNAVITDDAWVNSFRTSPHRNAQTSSVIPNQSIDPYAHFLGSISRRKYQENLQSRGLSPEGSPDRGHPFEIVRRTVTGSLTNAQRNATLIEGGLVTASVPDSLRNVVHNGWLSTMPTFQSGLENFGQLAYNRVAPTSTVFDAANFLGELREGLPRLASDTLKDFSKFYRGIGSDYLNVVFGWLPFITDLQNAGLALKKATEQLARNGKRVHRRYSVPTFIDNAMAESSSSGISIASGDRGMSPVGYRSPYGDMSASSTSVGQARILATKRASIDRWFEGEFSSFYPLGFNPDDYLSRLNVLVNTKVSPETLWNLAPWSWLVDWNLKLGDSIAANQKAGNDLLVMHYGYAMEKQELSSAIHATYSDTSWSRISKGITHRVVYTRKKRIRANPYGFKVNSSAGFNQSQLAILGALGLTRLR